MIGMRTAWKSVQLACFEYTGTDFNYLGYSVWYADDQTGTSSNQKWSMLLSTDETKIFTFTTGRGDGAIQATDCRMDVWDTSNYLAPTFWKGERNIQTRHCRLPSFHT